VPAASIVGELVTRGDTGRKVGRGFYVWPAPTKPPRVWRQFVRPPRKVANPVVYGKTPRTVMHERDVQDRLALLFVNEALRCLDEGVLQSPTDGDLGAVLGLGFPPFRGGPFHYADAIGRRPLTSKLDTLARRYGPRYTPAESLTTGTGSFFPKD
jgi:3-hydroxyacyl-CoA dehydrogenase/enoyl-CoA hydratase/3-hydroxybutyryl-CoA epimerase